MFAKEFCDKPKREKENNNFTYCKTERCLKIQKLFFHRLAGKRFQQMYPMFYL